MQELQVLLHELHVEIMKLSELFQVVAIIEKLPLSWRDFKNYHKHKLKEMNFKELIVRLRIEEDDRRMKRKFISQFGQALPTWWNLVQGLTKNARSQVMHTKKKTIQIMLKKLKK